MDENRRRRHRPQLPSSAANIPPPRGSRPSKPPGQQPQPETQTSRYERISLVDEGFRRLLPVCSPHKAAGRLHTACIEEPDCDLWCDGKLQDRNDIKRLTFEPWLAADGRWQLKIKKGVEAINTDGSRSFSFNKSDHNWEVSAAGIAALRERLIKEQLPAAPLQIEVIKMPEIKTVTSHPQSATSESKSEPQRSTPQSTHVQTEMWVNDPSIPPKWREIRRFVVKEYGDDWNGITTPAIIKAAEGNPEFKRRVRPFPATVTWNRALGRKRDRRRHRERH